MIFKRKDFLHNFTAITELRRKSIVELIEDLEELLVTSLDFDTWIDIRKKKYVYFENMTESYIYSCVSLKHNKRDMKNRKIAFGLLKSANVITDIRNKKWSLTKLQIKVNKEAYFELQKTMKFLEKDKLRIPAYRILYQEPSILIEGVDKALRIPQYKSDNEKAFKYICANPNRVISKAELKEKTGVTKDLNLIMKDLGFQKNLAKIFTKGKSKYDVYFRNPVYYEDLYNDKIEYIEPEKLVEDAQRKSAK